MDRNFILMLVGVVILLGGAFILAGGKSETANTDFEGNPFEVQADDYVKGEGTEGVTLIEYADFECPACAAFFPQLNQLEQEYGDEVQIVFRHFPLNSIHPNATAAHRASIAAGNQGAFWEMHDLLYQNQFTWAANTSGLTVSDAADVFEGYAEDLGLDIEQFRADVNAEETSNIITRGKDSANQLGVTGTPTLFLNGERISTTASYEELRILVAAAIDEANQSAEGAAEQQSAPAEAN